MTAKSWRPASSSWTMPMSSMSPRINEDPKIVAESTGSWPRRRQRSRPDDLEKIADQFRTQTVPEQAEIQRRQPTSQSGSTTSASLGGIVSTFPARSTRKWGGFQRALGFFTPPPPFNDQLLVDPQLRAVAYRRHSGCHQSSVTAIAHAESVRRRRRPLPDDHQSRPRGPPDGVGTRSRKVQDLGAVTLRRLACDAAIIPALLGGRGNPRPTPRNPEPVSALRAADHRSRQQLHLSRLPASTRLVRMPPPSPLATQRPHQPRSRPALRSPPSPVPRRQLRS